MNPSTINRELKHGSVNLQDDTLLEKSSNLTVCQFDTRSASSRTLYNIDAMHLLLISSPQVSSSTHESSSLQQQIKCKRIKCTEHRTNQVHQLMKSNASSIGQKAIIPSQDPGLNTSYLSFL